MPDLTLSFSNPQWVRIQEAFKKDDGGAPTAAEMVAWIRRQIRARVVHHETGRASVAAEAQKLAELQAEGW